MVFNLCWAQLRDILLVTRNDVMTVMSKKTQKEISEKIIVRFTNTRNDLKSHFSLISCHTAATLLMLLRFHSMDIASHSPEMKFEVVFEASNYAKNFPLLVFRVFIIKKEDHLEHEIKRLTKLKEKSRWKRLDVKIREKMLPMNPFFVRLHVIKHFDFTKKFSHFWRNLKTLKLNFLLCTLNFSSIVINCTICCLTDGWNLIISLSSFIIEDFLRFIFNSFPFHFFHQ